jgi:PAS domain S-box-containing protein/putative nucleotidyltransferase with HDIG domain
MAGPDELADNAREDIMRIFGRPGSPPAPARASASPEPRNGGAPLPGPVVRTETKPYKPPYINERKKYELIIAASGQVVYDYDLSSGDIVWSGNLEQVLGYEPQEMGGIAEWAERIHPDDRDEALRLLDIAEKDRTTYDVDYRFRHRNGSYRWLHDRGSFLIEDDRNLRRMIGMMQDIHDRKQAEILQNAVYRIAQAADTSAGMSDLFRSVHGIIGTVMPAGNFYLALYDAAQDLISFPYFVDEEDTAPSPKKPGKGLTEYVIRTGRPLLCDESTDKELRSRGDVEVVGAPSAIWLGVPLIVDGKTTGAMVVQHYTSPTAYGPRELRMLEYVSSQVARSIERKRAEEALRLSEQGLSLHISKTPLAVIEWDTEFRVRQWNQAAERIFGWSAEEATGRHASFIVPDGYKDQVDRVWGALMANAGGDRSTNENVTKDGRTIACEWYNTPLIDGAGRIIGVASLAQDVTKRMRAEGALRDSEELYRRLVASIPDIIIRTDLAGNIVFANEVAARLNGNGNPQALVGRSVFDFIVPEDREKAVLAARRMFDVKIGAQELGLIFATGAVIPFEIDGAVLRNPEGAPYGIVYLCRNITDRKRAETDLRDGLTKLRSTLKASIDSLASAIEMRDPYTAGHQERVTDLARAIAVEMGLAPERVEAIEIAGVIHDIGKLYVPAEILSKPTKLTDLEYAMIKMHAQAGYTILSKIDFPWPIARIVHEHHELVNGAGYPQGLAGKDILLEARILCVADVVEAMSSHRPYRPALGIGAALEEIAQKRGILYDREVVDACLRIFREKLFKFD